MDKLALISGEQFLYWNSIVYTLAAATAICFFLAFYLGLIGKLAIDTDASFWDWWLPDSFTGTAGRTAMTAFWLP